MSRYEMVARATRSPLGEIVVAAREAGICRVVIGTSLQGDWLRWFEREYGARPRLGSHHWVERFVRELEEYVAGERRSFDVPVVLAGTEFQERVWRLLLEIPYGATKTYGELARELGNPRSCRAVGRAAAQNPVPILVPCHRLVGAGGRLVGFSAGLELKERLLEIEGVRLRWNGAAG
ncbi:MAG: methylated-DNA--[protein]-cysteine S-methyltransferase [Acidobacteriota bacterium]